MKYLITCVVVLLMTLVARSQNEDKPFCVIPQDSIVKHKITMLAREDKTYWCGVYRKKYSYNIIYTFDSTGNITSQDWISLKTKKRDHINTYTYDAHGNLIGRKIDGQNLHMKYAYYYRYDSSGRMDQYYTEPRQKLLFQYQNTRLSTKLKVTPTDTLEMWFYAYAYHFNHLIQEVHTTKGSPTDFVTYFVYENNNLQHEVHLINTDTIYTVIYTYDTRGNKISEVQTHRMKGNEKTWQYGNNGQLISYQNKEGKDIETQTYTYSPDGLLFEIKRKSSVEWGTTEKSKLFYKFKP